MIISKIINKILKIINARLNCMIKKIYNIRSVTNNQKKFKFKKLTIILFSQ